MKKKFISIDKEVFDQQVKLQRRKYPAAVTYTELMSAIIKDLEPEPRRKTMELINPY